MGIRCYARTRAPADLGSPTGLRHRIDAESTETTRSQKVDCLPAGLSSEELPQLRDRSGQLHFWQDGPGYDRNLTESSTIHASLEYIHNNPVKRGSLPLIQKDSDLVQRQSMGRSRYTVAGGYGFFSNKLIHVQVFRLLLRPEAQEQPQARYPRLQHLPSQRPYLKLAPKNPSIPPGCQL